MLHSQEYCKNFDVIAFYETWQEQQEELKNLLIGTKLLNQ